VTAHLLVVAGLDPSAGAGILADARVAADHGARAVGVVTALTVQDTQGVRAVHATPGEVVGDQLRALLSDVELDAVKIGMLGDARMAEVVADALAATRAPVVWDPVRIPGGGHGPALFAGDLREAARHLLPEARLVTPNLDEAAALSGLPRVATVPEMRAAAAAIRALGAAAVLVKGGHLAGDEVVDVLDDGERARELPAVRVAAGPVHGTGCVLSSAIACALAAGASLDDAVNQGRAYLRARLVDPISAGRGARVLV
jgi:hydroxymethylpyrimidine/phosphomethylpyrimidine kinase